MTSYPDPATAPPTEHLDHPWPRSWQAEWIAAQPVAHPDGALPESKAEAAGEFARHLYRGRVHLDAVPACAPLRVTADSRYALYVNGVEIGRGPVRSQPRRMRYDSFDVAAHLHPGENVVLVLVTYYGAANSFWQPSSTNDNLGRTGVLALEADLGERWLVTGPDWEARPGDAWSQWRYAGVDGVPVECFDARLVEAEVFSGTSGTWAAAHVQPAGHMGSLARTHPPTDPYGPLLPRPIGVTGRSVRRPVGAGVGLPQAPGGVELGPAMHVVTRWEETSSRLEAADPQEVSFTAQEAQVRAVALDLGRVVAGRVGFALQAPEGTVVDLLYREVEGCPADAPMSVPKTAARYVARGHQDRFTAQEVNGFRHAYLLITTPGPGPVRIQDFQVREELYRTTGEAFFRSADAELNALYQAGIRTVELNAQDAYTDCPTREQRAWVGDGVVHQMVHLTTSTDWRMAHWYVELGCSPRPDGLLPMSVVGEIESSQQYTIPDWGLYWIHAAHNLLRYSGDREALAAAAPVARRILEWYAPFQTEDGVLADVPEWNLVDWSSILLNGRSSILTGMWARGLRDYAEISDFLANTGDAAWARQLWDRARGGYDSFWNEARGTYVDHAVDGENRLPASQLAGALAVVSGLAPAARHPRILAWISDPDRQVVRSWIGGNGGYDFERMLEQIRGIQRIDWDAANETVIAQPFASCTVHEAYLRAGRPDLVAANLRRWSTFLTDGYDTFGECWGWGTPAHGWSSTPTSDVITALLGVTPDAAGFAGARVAPAFGVLEWAEAAVPTPRGLLHVDLKGDQVVVDSPVPVTVVDRDGAEHRHPAGRWEIG